MPWPARRDVRADTETSFTLLLHGEPQGRVTLATPGAHNVANAVAAAAAADALGIAPDVIVRALSAFPGVRRRFEIIEDGDVTFVDDYAHHPHAVALTVAAARQRFPGRRLIAAFQPTLFTRLHRFLEPFAAAFDEADEAIVVEIQPSRERDTGLIHGNDLVKAIAARPAWEGRAPPSTTAATSTRRRSCCARCASRVMSTSSWGLARSIA